MGFLKKLLGIGVTAGATVAAVKVAEQVKENNPDGVQDVNGDGNPDTDGDTDTHRHADADPLGSVSGTSRRMARS